MDTRRGRPIDGGEPAKTDLTDTGLVSLVELRSVGGQGWRDRPVVLLIVAVAGVLALAALAVAMRPPEPSPSIPAIGLASPTPGALTTAIGSPAAPNRTPTPTRAPTPTPTPAPAWAWHREDLLPAVKVEPLGLWSVHGQWLLLAQQPAARPIWSIGRATPGEAWELLAVPPAIDDLMGGSVVDDRLWFVARVGGVTDADATYQLVSTGTGDDWSSFGVSDLPEPSGVSFIGRVAGHWVVSTWRYRADAGEGAGEADLLWSRDGLTWQSAVLPALRGIPWFYRVAMFGDTMVVQGALEVAGREEGLLLTSKDGITWEEADDALPEGYTPTGLACSRDSCVVLVSALDEPSAAPIARQTTDLEVWFGTDIDAPTEETAGFLTNLISVDDLYLAVGRGTGYAFLSEDGLTWRSLQVIVAPSGMNDFVGVAALGDVVAGIVRGPDNGHPSVWSGPLPVPGFLLPL